MNWDVDRAEIKEARDDANRALHVWKNDPLGDRMSTDEMFEILLHWVGLEIAFANQGLPGAQRPGSPKADE